MAVLPEREDDALDVERALFWERVPLVRGVASDCEGREEAFGEKVAGVGLSGPPPLGPGDASSGEPELACILLAPEELALSEGDSSGGSNMACRNESATRGDFLASYFK